MAIETLMDEYLSIAKEATSIDYSDAKSVRRFNSISDRMRVIVNEVVSLGDDAVLEFAGILDSEPAAAWAAHHLIETANLDSSILSRCFARVEKAKAEAEAKGNFADAMGEEMWLKEWKARKAWPSQVRR